MIELNNTRPGEKVVRVIKVHWIGYVILASHGILTMLIWISFHFALWFTALSFLFSTILWIMSLIVLYIEWLNYELDMYVITNNRIIWIEQISFLNRTVSETNLAQVQEVNSSTKWFFANIFNYWDVLIQTAWNKTTLSMWLCPDPIQEARKILNIVESYKESRMKNMIEMEEEKINNWL